MKAYTDLEQGKRLVEILPIESADMYYQYVLPESNKLKHNPEIGNPSQALEWYNKGYTSVGKEPLSLSEYCIPCWSLAALFNTLPKTIGSYSKMMGYFDDAYHCDYLDEDGESLGNGTTADTLIDAVYEMLLKQNTPK